MDSEKILAENEKLKEAIRNSGWNKQVEHIGLTAHEFGEHCVFCDARSWHDNNYKQKPLVHEEDCIIREFFPEAVEALKVEKEERE